MKIISSTTLFVLSVLFLSTSYAGPYQTEAYQPSQAYYPGVQHQQPDRRYEQRLPRRHEQRFRAPPHQQRNAPTQQGNSRAGENQFGSGNTQMPRPPQMNQPGPAQGRDQGYRSPERRYNR